MNLPLRDAAITEDFDANSELPAIDCVPACEQRRCGLDAVCLSSCGECEAGLECDDGACRVPLPLRADGESCGRPQDCISKVCRDDDSGAPHCYRDAGPNEACRNEFDCRAGICIGRTSDSAPGVCADSFVACKNRGLGGTCYAKLAVEVCQKQELCGTNPSPFDVCIRAACEKGDEIFPDCESARTDVMDQRQGCIAN
jgi:hypothetical protein